MKDSNRRWALTLSLFAIYAVALVWVIVFKMQPSLATLPSRRTLNLAPFSGMNAGRARSDALYNLLVFIPYGVYICLLKREWPLAGRIGVICLTSLLFEMVQYALGIGAADINDLLFNTLGGAVGVGLYVLFEKLLGARGHRVLNILALAATLFTAAALGVMSWFITYRF